MLVVLSATRAQANVAIQGAVLGVALALVNIMGIPIDGASVNPARSFGPAIVVGGQALSQLWLFLIAPLVGAVLAAGVFMLFHPGEGVSMGEAGTRRMRAQPAMTVSAADEGDAGRSRRASHNRDDGCRPAAAGRGPSDREAGARAGLAVPAHGAPPVQRQEARTTRRGRSIHPET